MGGMEMRLRAGGGGGPSLFALGGASVRAEGVLRGTKPAVRGGKEFSGGDVMARTVCDAGALLVARAVNGAGARNGGAVSAGREQRHTTGADRGAGALEFFPAPAQSVEEKAGTAEQEQDIARGIQAAAGRALDPRSPGCGAM